MHILFLHLSSREGTLQMCWKFLSDFIINIHIILWQRLFSTELKIFQERKILYIYLKSFTLHLSIKYLAFDSCLLFDVKGFHMLSVKKLPSAISIHILSSHPSPQPTCFSHILWYFCLLLTFCCCTSQD